MFHKRQCMSSSSSSLAERKRLSLAESIGYNEDIMTEISLYLPVKSILRFRSVSKQWYSLLTHAQFIQHYSLHKSTNSLLFFEFCSGIESLHLKGSHNHNLDIVDFGYMKNSCQDKFSLKKSCNGLLLFESRVRRLHPLDLDLRRHRYYVCNPSTRKYIELEVPDSIATSPYHFVNLAFDPSKSPYYKVVFFWNNKHSSTDYHITIYSSKTRTCRTLEYTFTTHDKLLFTGTFLKGAIHWVCNTLNKKESSLFYFDINLESIREFPRPPYSSLSHYLMYFGDCQSHLYLIFCRDDDFRFSRHHVFDVYELKEDYSSWFAKYKVDLDDIAIDFPEIIYHVNKNSEKDYAYTSFLCVLEEDEDPTLILSVGNQLLAYNFIAKSTRKICDNPYLGGYTKGSSNVGANERIVRSICWYKTFRCIEGLFDV